MEPREKHPLSNKHRIIKKTGKKAKYLQKKNSRIQNLLRLARWRSL